MMLAKFRNRYPQGSLVSELIEVDRGFYLVKVSIQVEQIVLATGLAGASTIEAAEDSARERAIAALVLDDLHSAPQKNSTPNTASSFANHTELEEQTVAKISLETKPKEKIINFSQHQPEASTEVEDPAKETAPTSILNRSDSIDLEAESESSAQPNLFSGTASPTEISLIEEESNSEATLDSQTAIASTNFEEMDFNEIKQKTDIEIRRLGWTKDDGREFLKSRYGKRSRLHLTDEQLLEFLGYLEQQPTPVK